ncbi:MAG: rane protein [Bacteroidota bacterium]|nr:rane protein [Bacteroidota bacterium]
MENQAAPSNIPIENTTKNFLRIGKAEGYSFLILLFIAMPLKYIAHHPEYVRIAGTIHGILFIAFIYTIIQMYHRDLLTTKKSAFALLMSLLPFGTFFLKRLL